MCSVWSSRGREIRLDEEGPYMRRRMVLRVGFEGYETKNTALVSDPETLDTFSSSGTKSPSGTDNHVGTRSLRMRSSRVSANAGVLYRLRIMSQKSVVMSETC